MIVFNVGIDLTRQGGFTRLDQLEEELANYQELCFVLLEINPSPFNLIVNGEVRRPQLANFLAVMGNFDSATPFTPLIGSTLPMIHARIYAAA